MSTSRSLNKVILIGNLTRNPVLKKTTSGSVVCNFGLATNATWKDISGSLQERTEFHTLVAWNKLGEICAQILAVGMLVYVEGELRTRAYDDSNGVRHYRTEIKIDDMKLLDDKGKKGVGVEVAMTESAVNANVPVEEELVVEKAEKVAKTQDVSTKVEGVAVVKAGSENNKVEEDTPVSDDGDELF